MYRKVFEKKAAKGGVRYGGLFVFITSLMRHDFFTIAQLTLFNYSSVNHDDIGTEIAVTNLPSRFCFFIVILHLIICELPETWK
ncbi:hypothetical protein CDAR_19281 [Caerostris darwini]|uniref:Uncharacterized protein n=1 Tax=Caerostris darwini TaxID=1538125 RepID=A0AAV4WD41_9ARAC|nr:hypothetical protein CDAR_19281 [Caerostris darwini]